MNTTDNVEFHDAKITTTLGASFKIENSNNLILDNVATMKPIANTPLIKLKDVSNMAVTNNFPMFATDVFLEADGAKTKAVYLKNNIFNNVTKVLKKVNDLHKNAIIE